MQENQCRPIKFLRYENDIEHYLLCRQGCLERPSEQDVSRQCQNKPTGGPQKGINVRTAFNITTSILFTQGLRF